MKIKVTKDKVFIIRNDYVLNQGEYNANECVFDFSEEYTEEMVKKALFKAKNSQNEDIKIEIVITKENEEYKCNVPYEITNEGIKEYELGVYAYVIVTDEETEEETLKLRYSPTPTNVYIRNGSYEGSNEIITPSQFEQYEQKLNDGLLEVSRVNIDAEQTENGATVTITNRNNEEKTVFIANGVDGKDGIDGKDGEQGPQGIQGPPGPKGEDGKDGTKNYNELENKPSINGVELSGNKTSQELNIQIDTSGLGASITASIDSSTYVMTLSLKNSLGTILNSQTIDLPLETMVVNGSYDDNTKKIILTLQSGSTIEFSVADLVSGLQSEITSSNKLNSDLVDDTNQANKFVTTTEKNTWNNKSDFSGDYNDLSNKPTIPTVPTNVSAFTNDANYVNTNDLNIALATKQNIIQYTTMPTATADTVGKIVQYKGTTTNDYTQGYFYIGVTDGESTPTYSWENINVQDGGDLSNYYTKTESDNKYVKNETSEEVSTNQFYVLGKTAKGWNIWKNKRCELGNTDLSRNVSAIPTRNSTGNMYCSTPTENTHTANKQYVDSQVATRQDIIQYSTLPTADSTNVGKIVQYIGTTDQNYTNGYFYIGTSETVEEGGVETTTYSWTNVEVQQSSGGGSDKVFILDLATEGTQTNPFILSEREGGIYFLYSQNESDNPIYKMYIQYDTTTQPIEFTFNQPLYKYKTDTYFYYSKKDNYSNGEYIISLLNNFTTYTNQSGIHIGYNVVSYDENSTKKIAYSARSWLSFINTSVLNKEQTITAKKTFNVLPESSVAPTTNNQLTNKAYVDNLPTTYSGYDATKTQVLKNVNGTLTWETIE